MLDASADPTGPVVVVGSKRAPGALRRPEPASAARHRGVQRDAPARLRAHGLGHPRHEGAEPPRAPRRGAPRAGTARTCSTPSSSSGRAQRLRGRGDPGGGDRAAAAAHVDRATGPPHASLGSRAKLALASARRASGRRRPTDGRDVTTVPGFVDLQVNGVADVDFSRADGDDWARAGRILLAAGVTWYLATICSMPLDRYDDALARVAAARQAAGAGRVRDPGRPPRGPVPRRRARRAPGASGPADGRRVAAGLLDRHPGLVRLVTLAPEADPDGAGIRMLTARGVVVALGHTAARTTTRWPRPTPAPPHHAPVQRHGPAPPARARHHRRRARPARAPDPDADRAISCTSTARWWRPSSPRAVRSS